ncbi:hypothetical protein RSAG8_12772, partial [Rhizoctonia solani AG-8 WAC10335]
MDAILKVYDHRFADSARTDWDLGQFTPEHEAEYVAYANGPHAPRRLAEMFEGGDKAHAEDTGTGATTIPSVNIIWHSPPHPISLPNAAHMNDSPPCRGRIFPFSMALPASLVAELGRTSISPSPGFCSNTSKARTCASSSLNKPILVS